MKNILRDKFGE